LPSFFDSAVARTAVTHQSATFELPIHYYRDDAFMLMYSADLAAVRAQLPSDRLHPVLIAPGRAVVAVVAFNYLDTSIGPYGELGIAVPVVFGAAKPVPLLPALLEAGYPGFGMLVLHLPVTTTRARDAGRGQWGYTKLVVDMHFEITPEHLRCRLADEGRHILTLQVDKGGWFATDRRPLITYSVKDGDLIRTTIPQKASLRWHPRAGGSWLALGDHPLARSVQALDLSPRPLLKRYYIERSAILPAGQIVERGVRPLDGLFGRDREGELSVTYLARDGGR